MTRKRTLALLLASAALTAALGAAALPVPPERASTPALGVDDGRIARPFLVASDDDDEDERRRAARDRDDDDDDDDCDDDEDCGGNGTAPAPAGPAVPPPNGLFGTGAPPQVRVN